MPCRKGTRVVRTPRSQGPRGCVLQNYVNMRLTKCFSEIRRMTTSPILEHLSLPRGSASHMSEEMCNTVISQHVTTSSMLPSWSHWASWPPCRILSMSGPRQPSPSLWALHQPGHSVPSGPQAGPFRSFSTLPHKAHSCQWQWLVVGSHYNGQL